MVDPERRDGDPRALLVGVEGQHVWDQPTERFRRHRVMQKKQVVPALRHDPRRHGRGPGAMRGGKENGVGAHPTASGSLPARRGCRLWTKEYASEWLRLAD